jgi:hypothetical protein
MSFGGGTEVENHHHDQPESSNQARMKHHEKPATGTQDHKKHNEKPIKDNQQCFSSLKLYKFNNDLQTGVDL